MIILKFFYWFVLALSIATVFAFNYLFIVSSLFSTQYFRTLEKLKPSITNNCTQKFIAKSYQIVCFFA